MVRIDLDAGITSWQDAVKKEAGVLFFTSDLIPSRLIISPQSNINL